ncbi:MAG: KEOPS complex kinase/ATPase Bud32 [Candidatus Heimdallarchaeaceae archaeon]
MEQKTDYDYDFWGAEAELTKIKWFGLEAIKKVRISKKYRISEIDEILRKKRTITEAKLLISAKKAKVQTPFVYDIETKKRTIIMEFINGTKVKDFLKSKEIDKKVKRELMEEIGKKVGLLHSNGLIHGDLTTSNILIKNNKLVFIDFGLGKFSNEIEDKAVDVLLMKKCLTSTHAEDNKEYFYAFQKGYISSYIKGSEILKRALKVEARGRHLKESDVISEYIL